VVLALRLIGDDVELQAPAIRRIEVSLPGRRDHPLRR
jgi:hypothetical protein